MRFGLVIDGLDRARPLDDLLERATAAQEVGFDLVWLAESAALPAPAIAAAALAPRLSGLSVGIAVTAGVNPIYLAEEAAVADLCLRGRLVFGIGSPDAGLLAETIEVLLAATAARPFRHRGERWQIPANLPDNTVNRADRVRVTPATGQLEMPIWVTGPHGAALGAEWGLSFVGEGTTAALSAEWESVRSRLGMASARLRRIAVRSVEVDDGDLDDRALWQRLRDDQRCWGMDVALLRLPELPAHARRRALQVLAQQVLPRVQLDRLPDGLEEYWRQREEMPG